MILVKMTLPTLRQPVHVESHRKRPRCPKKQSSFVFQAALSATTSLQKDFTFTGSKPCKNRTESRFRHTTTKELSCQESIPFAGTSDITNNTSRFTVRSTTLATLQTTAPATSIQLSLSSIASELPSPSLISVPIPKLEN